MVMLVQTTLIMKNGSWSRCFPFSVRIVETGYAMGKSEIGTL